MNKAKKQINAARKKGLSPLELAQMKAIAKKHAESMEQEATEKAFVLMLAIPCLILGEDYWKKTAKKRIPQFVEDCASMYESFQMGVLTYQDMLDSLKEMADITIEAAWLEAKKKEGAKDD